MKIVVAMDSFKGSMTSMEAGNAVREGILEVLPKAEVVVRPVADGGEGTVEAMVSAWRGELVQCLITGPNGSKVTAAYGVCAEKKTAIIEIAQAAGLMLMQEKNPWKATSYGIGEMILHAIGQGCRKFYIGLGGSAVNDCGIGMLEALGICFYDKNGNRLKAILPNLGKIEKIVDTGKCKDLEACTFITACDVNNPLCGINGATYVFGPQKGVRPEEKELIDQDMRHFASVCAAFCRKDMQDAPGAGAAGGLGFAFFSFLNAGVQSGIELILNASGLEKELEKADIVITGEGQLDEQTMMGKVPVGIAALAKRNGCMVIALAGNVKVGKNCNKYGIDAFFSIQKGTITLQEAMKKNTAYINLKDTTEQIFRVISRKKVSTV